MGFPHANQGRKEVQARSRRRGISYAEWAAERRRERGVYLLLFLNAKLHYAGSDYAHHAWLANATQCCNSITFNQIQFGLTLREFVSVCVRVRARVCVCVLPGRALCPAAWAELSCLVALHWMLIILPILLYSLECGVCVCVCEVCVCVCACWSVLVLSCYSALPLTLSLSPSCLSSALHTRTHFSRIYWILST